jgi:hypothetical protein
VFELPSSAAWRHRDARLGFEVLFTRPERGCLRLEGHSTAVEEDEAWAIRYDLTLDERWVTRSAHVVARSVLGVQEVRLEADGTGVWQIDGRPRRGSMGAWTSISKRRPLRMLCRYTGWDSPWVDGRMRPLPMYAHRPSVWNGWSRRTHGFRTMARSRATSTSRRRSISVRFSPTTGSG